MLPRCTSVAALLLAFAVMIAVPRDASDPRLERQGVVPARQGLGEVSELNASAGQLRIRRSAGRLIASAEYCGRGGNGYARALFRVRWSPGDQVRYGAQFRLPRHFDEMTQSEVAIMRWDGFGHDGSRADVGGIVIRSDGRAALVGGNYRGEWPLTAPFDLPRGRWFTIEVAQKLAGDSEAHNAVAVDGRVVRTSAEVNSWGRGVDRVRYGIVAISAGRQHADLTLSFSRPFAEPASRRASSTALRRTATRCA
jgi:hypothetical protein